MTTAQIADSAERRARLQQALRLYLALDVKIVCLNHFRPDAATREARLLALRARAGQRCKRRNAAEWFSRFPDTPRNFGRV